MRKKKSSPAVIQGNMVKYPKVTCKQLEHRGKDSMMHQTQQRDLHQQD